MFMPIAISSFLTETIFRAPVSPLYADMRRYGTRHFFSFPPISQARLAKEIKTSQQVISRLESPRDKRMPSLELLDRVARALKRKLVISLQS